MTHDPRQLIDGYLDDMLSTDEQDALTRWLNESTSNVQQFAQATLLHDRLRGDLLALPATDHNIDQSPRCATTPQQTIVQSPGRVRSFAAIIGFSIAASVVLSLLWFGLLSTQASAAVVELNRIIAANAKSQDRTYQIVVEESETPDRRADRAARADRGRPPKPPLHGAMLHVRGSRQFVLLRTTLDGLPFVTGCNGKTSWAVRPDGPVRFSSDLTRFNHDVPGHEHSMPLNNIEDGLGRLREAYDVQLLRAENTEADESSTADPSQLIVAMKKQAFRGPARVEISYAANSGLIRQIRFVEMPYGPDRITLRMTLIEEHDLGTAFFHHESHHAFDRVVEEE